MENLGVAGSRSSCAHGTRRGLGGFFFFFFWEGTQDFSASVISDRFCGVTPDLHEVGWGEAGGFLSKQGKLCVSAFRYFPAEYFAEAGRLSGYTYSSTVSYMSVPV